MSRPVLRRLAVAALALATLHAPLATAQAWPAKPMRLVVTFAPGGAADTVARLLSVRYQEAFGQPVVVENRPGANGNIGADSVAKAPPDGYSFLVADLGTFTSGPAVYPNLPFDPLTDFTPISGLIVSPYGLAVNPGLPVSNVRELLAWAKANPGKFNYAMLGNGSASHLAGVELSVKSGVPMTFVPYKGGAPALADVAAGQSQALAIAMLSTYPFVRGGKLKLLGVMSERRLSFLPDVPTLAEAGVPGLVAGQWQALYGPKGLPREVVERMRAETVRYLELPETRKRFADQGAEVAPLSPEALTKFVADEKAKYTKLVRDNGIKGD
jgi:tripartite-type tricarboxylate transporter receptor subunit TctC